jgi:hypothetical protein
MGLFGKNRAEKEAEAQAAQAEVDRLLSLSRVQLAAELLPAFGKNGAKRLAGQTGPNLAVVILWTMRDHPKATGFMKDLEVPVREATQLLENANLVEKRTYGGQGHFNATTLGEQAILDNSALQYLSNGSA